MPTAKPLKILFLTYQGDVAGSTNSIAYLAKGLANRGHKVWIGIRKESLLWSLLESSPVERIAMTFKGKFDTNNWRHIRNIVQANDIQIINPQSSHDRYTSIFSKWRYGLSAKIVHTRRQMPMSSGAWLQRYLYNRRTDGVVAVSEQVASGLIKTGIRKNQIKVIYNGTPKEKYDLLDDQLTDRLKIELNISPEDFVIGCVSRPKNQIQLIKALAILKDPVTVIFCGLEATEEMKAIIDSFTVRHSLHFIGHVPAHEILSYYGLFDIKVLASTMEGLSQSLLEAMALGVPVIATAYAGNLDLIQDRLNGLLFADGAIEELVHNIEELRDNLELREKLIDQGRHTALEAFTIENTISNYEEYFSELIEE